MVRDPFTYICDFFLQILHNKEKFLIEPEYERGICPICKKENIIEKTNELVDLWNDFISVICNECGKKLILKKESNQCN